MHNTMKIIFLVALLCAFNGGLALQGISDEIYAQFPPIRHLDRFDPCVDQTGGVYCTAHVELYADEPNEIFECMTNYSSSAKRHFNYSLPIYGFCVTRRCKQFYTGDTDEELHTAMEQCLEDFFQRKYSMRANLIKQTCYRHGESKFQVNMLDRFASALMYTLLALVAIGTIYDVAVKDKNPKGFLMCFSLPANWKALKAPWPQDPKSSRLVGINCMRTIISCMVVMAHASTPVFLHVENPKYAESMFEARENQMFIHSHLNMQTFIFLSGLFLTYSLQHKAEQNQLTWRGWLKAIFMRWLRFTPLFAASLLFNATAMKFSGTGPMWQESVGDEIEDCHKHWFSNILFLNNYVDNNQCALHHWTTAVDMQLHILGLSIMFLLRSDRARQLAIGAMFVLGLVLPAVETYAKDLDGSFLPSAMTAHEPGAYLADKTFVQLFMRTHTNMPCFFMGMAMGLYLCKVFQKPIDTEKYKKYSALYWLLLPALIFVMQSNAYIYLRDSRAPLPLRLLYAVLQKPAWGAVIAGFILGLVYRVEKVPLYTRVLEWPGWVPLTRLTYSTYNVHIFVVRYIGGIEGSLTHLTDLKMFLNHFGYISISFALATLVWLFLEAPMNNLLRIAFPENKPKQAPVEPKKIE